MSTHPESEQLSAFVDGELTEREQVSMEAHVASCSECRSLLSALRATIGDLAALEQPEMDEQTSWAIRKAVARERRLGARGRWTWAAGAVAASLVGILAFVLVARSGGDSKGAATRGPAADAALLAGGDYNARTAQAELDRFASGWVGVTGDAMRDAEAPAPIPAQVEARSGAKGAQAYSVATDETTSRDIARCERAIKTAGADITLVQAIVGTYERKPALLLFYEAPAENPKRIELWVVRRDSCDVLLFRQKSL